MTAVPDTGKPSGNPEQVRRIEDTPLNEAAIRRLGAVANDEFGYRPEVGSDQDLAISVRGLCNEFGEQIVHQDLDLDVRRGEILGVVGGSGTGKSVLMRSILGLNRPIAGTISVFGTDALTEDDAVRCIVSNSCNTGVLFQDGALFSSLTVAENVAMPLKEHHDEIDGDLRDQLVRLKIRLAGLPDDAADKLPPRNCRAACRKPRLDLRVRSHSIRTCCSSTSRPQASTRSARPRSTS